jgi:transcriptional regulator GlxA family with amidase domain
MASENVASQRTVGILVFDGVEVLDFCGPFEVFSTAALSEEEGGSENLFRALIIAEDLRMVTTRGGMMVLPHNTIEDNPPLDIVVVPGGPGTRRERLNKRLLDWISQQAAEGELMTSVCTGAFLLAGAGLLHGRRATTHWASVDWMRETYPDIHMEADARFVDEGKIVTSAGVSAGIDMALHIVERLHGKPAADWTARRMEYDRRK